MPLVLEQNNYTSTHTHNPDCAEIHYIIIDRYGSFGEEGGEAGGACSISQGSPDTSQGAREQGGCGQAKAKMG